MATKFFTNTEHNTLLQKFEGIFKYCHVHYFDALVGYFRSSGYFRIRKFLKDVHEIRILVGINVDLLISEATRKGLEFNFNTEVTRNEFFSKLKEDIQQADYKKDVEDGILEFINDIISGKIKIKAHPNKNLHAKIYIFRPKEWNEHNCGSVITGSSNLTEAGMQTNFEFNVELRDYDDVAYATKTFEQLWHEAQEMLPDDIDKLKKTTYLNDGFSPFEIYIKFLIEYFGSSIEYDPESITDLPRGYKKLQYQIDAVNDGYTKLMKYNGFFLADVVGLGKTIIASIIAKKFYFSNGYRTRILVVYPPAIFKMWEKTIKFDFEVPNVDFITNGSLHKVKKPEEYDLIIVDEAHKFRSDESEMFNKLQKLCKTPRKRPAVDGNKQKKIILVTATPLNNRPEDIRNQIYLFQDSKNSTLEIANLQHFFRPLIDKYRKLKKEKDNIIIAREVKKIYDGIRNKVLEQIIVRRTRTDIRENNNYQDDIQKQGLTFPKIIPPRKVLYQLDENLNQLYDKTLSILKDTNSGLKYFRYQAIRFLKGDARNRYKQAERISEQLSVIMKILLVKRIDSSFHAFKKSLGRYYAANTAMLKMIKKNRIFIAPKLNVSEFILNEEEEKLEELLLDANDSQFIQAYSVDDFDVAFVEGIRSDQVILKYLVNKWAKIDYDPKYDLFIDRLKNELFDPEINKNNKLVIFSESKETTEHIAQKLKADGFKKVLAVDSSNQKDLAEIIEHNFDANIKATLKKNDYNILFTTEVLAEGVNLHRANVIINYDIPWNSTRLMQRIGRLNRIGTTCERIYIYNFFPTIQADNEIELNKKAFMKLQAFHTALGEDSQIYSTEEEYGTFGLFEKLPEEERDERLEYLMELRKFRDENPDFYKAIKDKLPKRARTGRKDATKPGTTITYIKNKSRDSFYFIKQDIKLAELTFVETAHIFKAQFAERSKPLHSLHHEQICTAVKAFEDELQVKTLGDRASVKLGPNEKKAIAFLNDMRKQEFVTNDEKDLLEFAKLAIRRGRFQKLPREINKLIREIRKTKLRRSEVFTMLIVILNSYPLQEKQTEIPFETDQFMERKINSQLLPEIIISESFV